MQAIAEQSTEQAYSCFSSTILFVPLEHSADWRVLANGSRRGAACMKSSILLDWWSW
jgi:hypothetical protein